MSTKKQILISEWQDRLQSFTSGNRGRKAAIAAGGMTIVENKPLVSVDYDPVGKGNDLMISVEGLTHTVQSPVEISIVKESDGVVSTLEVIDRIGKSTFLRFIN